MEYIILSLSKREQLEVFDFIMRVFAVHLINFSKLIHEQRRDDFVGSI